ncbi:MAG: anaerobic ribonucleoside-triphosphate reductase activating protein [Patescibacteria group bacterium]
MIIKGLVKLSLIDYPPRPSAVIFTAGCNFRCPFCHNPELVLTSEKVEEISREYVFSYLKQRAGLLDGVCVTGGEPTLHTDLPEFLRQIKAMGYAVKLDTNGTNPEMLAELIRDNLVDYLAMDLKTALGAEYQSLSSGGTGIVETIIRSIKLLVTSGKEYEFRTTVVPSLHTKASLLTLAAQLKGVIEEFSGGKNLRWFLQSFRPGTCLDPMFNTLTPFSDDQLQELQQEAATLVPSVVLRS